MAGRRKKTPEAEVVTLVTKPMQERQAAAEEAFVNIVAQVDPKQATILSAAGMLNPILSSKFATLSSNIKGGVNVKLSPCTAIVSKHNRAGKTAVLDSFRFALTGTHPIGPHAADLAGLTADGSYPRAEMSALDGACSASFQKGKKSVNHVVTGPLAHLRDEERAVLLPLSATRDLLTLGSAKAREELFRRFGDGLDAMPQPKGLDEQQRALFQRAYEAGSGDVVERLAAAGTWVRSHKRALSERLKAMEEEKSRLFGEASESGAVTDDVLDALEAKLAQWEAYKMGGTLRAHVDGLSATLNAMIDQFSALQAPISAEQLKAQFEAHPKLAAHMTETKKLLQLQDKLEADSGRLKLLSAVLTLRKALNGSACYVCATDFHGDVAGLVHGAEEAVSKEAERLVGLKAEIAAQQKVVTAAEEEWFTIRDGMTHNWQISTREYEQAKQRVKDTAEHFKREQEKATAVGAIVSAPDESEESIKSRLDAAKLALARSDRGEEVSAAIRQLKDEQGDCKAVEVVLEHTLTKLLEGVREKAEEAVNRWMPVGFKASLCLESSDGKPECRWEVIGRDGQPHRKGALSGAEWAALSVAIACAWTSGESHARYLLLDDADIAGFNPENLKATLDMISKAVREGDLTQALVAWSRPAEIPSEGWSVVEL